MANISFINNPTQNWFQSGILPNKNSSDSVLLDSTEPQDSYVSPSNNDAGIYSPKFFARKNATKDPVKNDPKEEKKENKEKPPLKDESKVLKEATKGVRETKKMLDGTSSEALLANREAKAQKNLQIQKSKTEALGLNDKPRSTPDSTFKTELNKTEALRSANLERQQNPLSLKNPERAPQKSFFGGVKNDIVTDLLKEQTAVAQRSVNTNFSKMNPLGTKTPSSPLTSSNPNLGPKPGKIAFGGKVFDKVMAPLGVVTGSYDMYNGANRFNGGDKVGGALEFTKGLGSTSTGLLTTTSLISKGAQTAGSTSSLFSTTAAGASTLSKALPVLGAVTSMADGALTTYDGVTTGDAEKTTVGIVKTAGGTMMFAGAVTGNPFLLGAGVVTYGGAVVYENRQAIANFGSYVWNSVTGGETTSNVPKTEDVTVTVGEDIKGFNEAVAAKNFMIARPSNNSSLEIRNTILSSVGYTDDMVKAYQKDYPTDKKTNRPIKGGFYVGNTTEKTWGRPEQVAKWPLNSAGMLDINVPEGSMKHLKEYYDAYVQRNGSPD